MTAYDDTAFNKVLWFDLYLEARAEIHKKIRCFFGPNDDTKKSFWK